MGRLHITIAVISIVALSGCSRLSGGAPDAQFGPDRTLTPQMSGQTLAQTQTRAPTQEVSSLNAAQTAASTDISTFLDPSIVARLSANEKAEAASAQYYALQFGRPAAPRSWQGDTGATGSVEVGPYVRVNSLDCREYTHKVTVSGRTYTSSGTACRDVNGNWGKASS